MPLEPLRFDTALNVRKSLARLKRRGLISINVMKSYYVAKVKPGLGKEFLFADGERIDLEKLRHLGTIPLDEEILRQNKIKRKSLERLREHELISIELVKPKYNYEVNVNEKLADELIVSRDGETYIYSDIFDSTDEELEREINNKLAENNHTINNILRNRPLAKAIGTLKFNSDAFSLPLNYTRAFAFPAIAPVITQDEFSEEEFKSRDYQAFCHTNNKANNLSTTLIPNNALDQLYTNSSKSREQLNDFKSGIDYINNRRQLLMYADYQDDIKAHPEFKNKNTETEVLDAYNKYAEKNARAVKGVRFVQAFGAVGAVGLGLIGFIAWPLAVATIIAILVGTGYLLHRLENKIVEKKAIADSIIAYQKETKHFGDMDAYVSKLSRKKVLVDRQLRQLRNTRAMHVTTAVKEKPSCASIALTSFARFFKSAPHTNRRVALPITANNTLSTQTTNSDARTQALLVRI